MSFNEELFRVIIHGVLHLCGYNDKTDIEFENGKLSISIDEKNSIHMKGTVSDIKEIEINL